MQLYPAQKKIVIELMALPKPRRAILPWETGCGKTVAACSLIKRSGAQSVLIICPAIVRDHWKRHVEDMTGLDCGVLIEGKAAAANRGLKAVLHWITEVQCAQVVIVSFDLAAEVLKMERHGFDLIIIDELHHVGNPKSLQSKRVHKLLRANPGADYLGLSATLIPTEVKQLWNPLRLFDGEATWGHPTKTGGIAWRFMQRYCFKEVSEYGTDYFGVRPDAIEPLKAAMSKLCFPLTRNEVLPDMPPLDLHVLTGDLWELVKDKIASVNKLLILCRYKILTKPGSPAYEEANRVTGFPPFSIDGSISPSKRMRGLENIANLCSSVTFATYDSMCEGVRLLWPDCVLIDGWQGSPGKLMQLLGRFVSVGSAERPQVFLVANDDTYSAAQAIAQRAPGILELGLGGSGLGDVAAKVEQTVSGDIDWDAMFSTQTADDWQEDSDG